MGAAVTAVQQATKELHLPASIATSFQGPAQAFQASLSGTPILILAAMIVVYINLGMLYESTIHPITIISTLPSALGYAIVGGVLVSQVLTLLPRRSSTSTWTGLARACAACAGRAAPWLKRQQRAAPASEHSLGHQLASAEYGLRGS